MNQPFIHTLADVQSAAVSTSTRIWQFVFVSPCAKLGQNCNICSHVLKTCTLVRIPAENLAFCSVLSELPSLHFTGI